MSYIKFISWGIKLTLRILFFFFSGESSDIYKRHTKELKKQYCIELQKADNPAAVVSVLKSYPGCSEFDRG